MNPVDLKERIAISADYSPEERDFLLDAINAVSATGPTVLHDPGSNLGRLDRIYAYLSVNDGGEGICGMASSFGNMPMVTAERRIADSLKGAAQHLARMANKPVRLVAFESRKDLELFRP